MSAWKSVVYCGVFGGLGYTLLLLVTPEEKKIAPKPSGEQAPENQSLAEKKRQAIVDVLRGAAESKKPIYLQTKEEIDKARDELLSKKKPPS